MKSTLIFLMLLVAGPSLADELFQVKEGEYPNHLIPVRYPAGNYHGKLAEHLVLTNCGYGLFVSRPSFTAESCVAVHKDNGKYYITFTKLSENLYQSKSKKIKVSRVDREISLELAVAIQRVWGQMLLLTRYPSKAPPGGATDGITYQFHVWLGGLGDLYGETWMPEGGLPAKMVEFGTGLTAFVNDKKIKEKPLIERLKAFEATIPKAEQNAAEQPATAPQSKPK